MDIRQSKREKTKNFVNWVCVPAIAILLFGWLFGVESMTGLTDPLTWFIITFLINNGLYKVVESIKPSKLTKEDSSD